MKATEDLYALSCDCSKKRRQLSLCTWVGSVRHGKAATKLGRIGDRFGDNLAVGCANFPCVSGRNQFTNTKFTTPITKVSKSTGYTYSRCNLALGYFRQLLLIHHCQAKYEKVGAMDVSHRDVPQSPRTRE